MTNQLLTEVYNRLDEFVGIRSLQGEPAENKRAVSYVTDMLLQAGFGVRVEGADELEQPVIVAHRPGESSREKLVIYGHYDVAPVGEQEEWVVPDPFKLTRQDDRLYGRGVADNKGTLLTRLSALGDLHRHGTPLPEILWLIQGKEEVSERCLRTADIFHREVEAFPAPVFLDETGFNDTDAGQSIIFLWSRSAGVVESMAARSAFKSIDAGREETRHLNKFNGGENCPLLCALPDNALYVGFGPGDRLQNIHRQNESLSEALLAQHYHLFSAFVSRYGTA